MEFVYLLPISVGAIAIWLALKVAEEVIQIALMLAGAIAFLLGFFYSPSEIQFAVEAVSLGGGWMQLRSRC